MKLATICIAEASRHVPTRSRPFRFEEALLIAIDASKPVPREITAGHLGQWNRAVGNSKT